MRSEEAVIGARVRVGEGSGRRCSEWRGLTGTIGAGWGKTPSTRPSRWFLRTVARNSFGTTSWRRSATKGLRPDALRPRTAVGEVPKESQESSRRAVP